MGAPLCSRPPPASGSRQLGRSRCPAAAAQRQQQQLPACSRAAAAKDSSGGGSSGGDAAVQQPCSQAVEQQQAGSQASLPLLQRAARAAAASAAAAVLALGSLAPPPAAAVLASPRAQLPRSADVALRRSIPAFNADVAEVQDRLEAVQFKLRIPQVSCRSQGLLACCTDQGLALACCLGPVPDAPLGCALAVARPSPRLACTLHAPPPALRSASPGAAWPTTCRRRPPLSPTRRACWRGCCPGTWRLHRGWWPTSAPLWSGAGAGGGGGGCAAAGCWARLRGLGRVRRAAQAWPGQPRASSARVFFFAFALSRLARAIEVKDPDRTSVRVANALEQVAALELLQARRRACARLGPGSPRRRLARSGAPPAAHGSAWLRSSACRASGAALRGPAAGPRPA